MRQLKNILKYDQKVKHLLAHTFNQAELINMHFCCPNLVQASKVYHYESHKQQVFDNALKI